MTSFDAIYERAILRFRDYEWLRFSDDDRDKLLRAYLHSAQADVEPICTEFDLSAVDEEEGQFAADLSESIIEILSTGVAYYWLSARVMNSENLKNCLSTKDYSFFSPANLLREMTILKKQVWEDYQRRITMYTYHNADIGNLSN